MLAEEHRQRCEVYSRVMGYLAPTWLWNNGKRSEFAERKTFRVKDLPEFRGEEQQQMEV